MIKAIIVDDEKKICKLIRYLVNWEEYNTQIVAEAYDGNEAYDIICREQPQLVVTDIRIPEMDGLELIRRCKESYPDMHFIVISGYDSFDYAHRAIKFGVEDYLLKPINQNNLIDAIARVANKIDNVISEKNEKMQMREQLKTISIALQKNSLEMLNKNQAADPNIDLSPLERFFQAKARVCQVVLQPIVSEESRSVESLLLNKMNELCQDLLRKDSFEALCTTYSPNVICLVDCADANMEALLQCFRGIRKIFLGWRDIWAIEDVHIGVSRLISELSLMRRCAKESNLALLQGLVPDADSINVYSGEMESLEGVNEAFANKDRLEIQSSISLWDEAHLADALNAVRDAVLAKGLSGYGIQQVFEKIADCICFSVDQASIEMDTVALRGELWNALHYSKDVYEIFERLIHTVSAHINNWNNVRQLKKTRPIRMAQQYIQENYMHPLSLDEISEIVGLSSCYFSSLFSKETGKTLTEHLIDVRMERAKSLLIQSNTPIADVADAVGYGDVKHFYKLFKKMTGIGPAEYRKLFG